MAQIIFHMVFSFLSSISFAIISNVPRKSLFTGGFVGMLGWMGYWGLSSQGYGVLVSSVVCSLLLALFGHMAARLFKMPLTVFYVPGLVPIVPGITAFEAFRQLSLHNYEAAGIGFLNVGYSAIGIACGLVISDIVFRSGMYVYNGFRSKFL